MSDSEHWWLYGDYNGEECPNCRRQRMMVCDDPTGAAVRVCEKCRWSPDRNDYVGEAA